MVNATEIDAAKMPSIHALEATNLFLADVQTGVGPMGHTHYNEIANDGRTLYSATRSTGQIEEGPVGYSITNIDGDAVSWRFVALGKLPVVVITSPSDARLLTNSGDIQGTLKARVKSRPQHGLLGSQLGPNKHGKKW